MKASILKRDITPSESCYMAGYERISKSTGVLDAIEINTIVWEVDHQILVYSYLDSIMIEQSFVDEVKQLASQQTGISGDQINIGCIHTHSAPAYFKLTFENTQVELELREKAKQQIVETIVDGYANLQEVTAEYSSCLIDGLYGNRNEKDAWSDKSVQTLAFYNKEKCLGSIVNIAIHPTILDGANLLLSSDLLGHIRQLYGEYLKAPVMIINGTTGDVSTRFYRVSSGQEELQYVSKAIVKQMIEKLAKRPCSISSAAIRTVEYTTHSNFQKEEVNQRIMHLEKPDSFLSAMQKRCALRASWGPFDLLIRSSVIKLGDIFFITLPGDVVSNFGRQIKEALASYHVFISCYTNGYCNYLVDEASYGKYFETFNSRCHRGEADFFIKQVIHCAKSMI